MAKRLKTAWHVALLASVLLFAQFAIASQVCMVAPMSDDGCLVQCIVQDQPVSSLDQHFHAVPPVIASAGIDFPLVATQAPKQLLPDTPLPAGPPLTVLFCSYQT
ncbi:MAG TPA: hypothetical protein VIV54_15095 [Burkholderiales bacterium]